MIYEIMPSCGLAQIETRINDIFNMAEICGWSSEYLNQELLDKITIPLNYKTPSGRRRHSVWFAGYASGIIAAKRSIIWREKVEFCYLVDGLLYSTWKDSTRRSTEEFYHRGEGHILSRAEGRHYWIGTNKPF